ncbi:MAG: amidohydrolase family protein [Cytophagaceae bacterium]|nr:amidohydrolase family protein [Cytophagaceae bacterium]MBL0326317.1 amidohydrolase family protein [Cytophagaceae bacterium]
MKVLLKNCLIVDDTSDYHLKKSDILINKGVFEKITEPDTLNGDFDLVFETYGLSVSKGWIDAAVHFKDPGFEWTESLPSLAVAAQKGGFTSIIGFPNTQPTVQTKESLAYFKNFSENKAVRFYNYAAVTLKCEGKDFTDMIDLYRNGAVGFSDGVFPIQSSDILLKTMQYLQPLGAVLVNKVEDKYLSMYGQMHEGITSTRLGLKGIPSAAEEIMIMRDLKLLEYSGIKTEKPLLHFSTISTAESVNLIREAKRKGLPVSCDISAHHLLFTENDLENFDSNLKVKPPFRSKSDIEALKAGLADGTIDIVVSDHHPLDSEHKDIEFDLAEFGAVGIQTLFGIMNKKSGLSLSQIIEKIEKNPRRIFNLEVPSIKEGNKAEITIFEDQTEFTFTEEQIVSLSKNSPDIGQTLRGKVLGTLRNNILSKNL